MCRSCGPATEKLSSMFLTLRVQADFACCCWEVLTHRRGVRKSNPPPEHASAYTECMHKSGPRPYCRDATHLMKYLLQCSELRRYHDLEEGVCYCSTR